MDSATEYKPTSIQAVDHSAIDHSGANLNKRDYFASDTVSISNVSDVSALIVSPLLGQPKAEQSIYFDGYTADDRPVRSEHVYELSTDTAVPRQEKRSTAGRVVLPRRISSLWDLRSGRVSNSDETLVR